MIQNTLERALKQYACVTEVFDVAVFDHSVDYKTVQVNVAIMGHEMFCEGEFRDRLLNNDIKLVRDILVDALLARLGKI